jgi:hypothetical protein
MDGDRLDVVDARALTRSSGGRARFGGLSAAHLGFGEMQSFEAWVSGYGWQSNPASFPGVCGTLQKLAQCVGELAA